jgi:hypothetical protein
MFLLLQKCGRLDTPKPVALTQSVKHLVYKKEKLKLFMGLVDFGEMIRHLPSQMPKRAC